MGREALLLAELTGSADSDRAKKAEFRRRQGHSSSDLPENLRLAKDE